MLVAYEDSIPGYQINLCQVSRSWLEKLRSPTVLKTTLDSWYDGAINFQDADLEFFSRKARSVHAFRSISQSISSDSVFKISAQFNQVHLLVGDNLIWREAERVHVLNMRSWKHRIITSAAREYVCNVHASDEVVAFSVMNHTVYVADVNKHAPLKRFRVSWTKQGSALTCRQRTVACAGYLEHGILVYTWNFDTQQGRSFNINYDNPILLGCHMDYAKHDLPGISLLLQPDTKTIMLCLLDAFRGQDAPCAPKIWYYRFTYAGDCLQGDGHLLSGYVRENQLKHGDGKSYRFVPASHNGLFMLQTVSTRDHSIVNRTIRTVQFDENLQAFTSSNLPGLNPTTWNDQGQVVWWKDTFVEADTKGHVIVDGGTTSNPCYDPTIAYSHLASGQRSRKILNGKDCKDLLMNDKYIVRCSCDEFHVYCYDHTVRLPGKEGTLTDVGHWKIVDADF